ncbi:esterase-like activity of phytase family protein [Yoonia sp. 208BN28-4]|uniref:esterase-like activity of phytase family protein n=1 Tax=Yoonia sp. 208BN28-4 TaxID=3126505 RepID=UPI0030B2335A
MHRQIVAALLLTCAPQAVAAPALEQFTWVPDDPDIGGLSAIEVADNGADFLALSDRGLFVSGSLVRDDSGRIVDVQAAGTTSIDVLPNAAEGRAAKDSEGLAIAPHGTIYVAFEGAHRVSAFDSVTATERPLPAHPDFQTMQNNSSLEALAIDQSGALYTLPERTGRYDRPFPIYRFVDGAWSIAMRLPRDGSFLAVGADFGPDGWLYILERDFTGISFRNQVRRVNLDTARAEIVLPPRKTFGNLEGISVWTDANGDVRVTMISDDNYHFLLQTQIIEFRLGG